MIYVVGILILCAIIIETIKNTNKSHELMFQNKYINKTFTKEDINNVSIFDITEVSNYINQGLYAYNYKIINMINTGINVVNDHNFSLQFHDDLGPGRTAIIYIHDQNQMYKIHYASCHRVDRIDLIYTKNGREKNYKFNDLGQIELYFNYLKIYKQLHNVKLSI